MQELQAERQAIKAALDGLEVDAWVYEADAGARDQSARATYLDELQAADLYVGVFWKRCGAYTIDEYRQATTWQKTAPAVREEGRRGRPRGAAARVPGRG